MRSTSVAIVTSRDRFELGSHTAACRACAFRTNGGFHDATPRGRHHNTPRLEQDPSEFITRLARAGALESIDTRSVADGEALSIVLRMLQLIDEGNGEILHRDPALARCVDEKLVAAE